MRISEISKKENKQGEGTVLQTVTISMDGQTNTFTETAGYFVIDKESIFYDDDEFKVQLTDNSLILTSTDDPLDVYVMTFSR